MPASNTPKRKKKKNPPATPQSPPSQQIQIHNHQKKHRINLRRLREDADIARSFLPGGTPHWHSLEISLVSPAASSRIHRQHLGDPAATDVITYDYHDHAELIICPAVAERQRHAHGLTLHQEILTYIIHGMLHLQGYDDHTETGFNRMRRTQEKLLNLVLQNNGKKSLA